jgi:reductive dehalogenase
MITPKYGPRVRLAKVLTDLPLAIDGPITFGVTEFCEICGKCAKTCPSQSISHGERTYESPATGNPGFYHWPVNGATCYMFWETVGADCNICIASCPFNKPQGWLHDATKILIGAKSGPLDKLLLNMDDASGYGEIKSLDASWDIYLKKDNFIHIKP